jgi:hypothetical protein
MERACLVLINPNDKQPKVQVAKSSRDNSGYSLTAPANNSQEYGNNCDDEEDMDNSSGMIAEETDRPGNNEDDGDHVQKISHNM